MLLTGIATLALQFRKNRNDAAQQLTNGALSLVEPLKARNKELEKTLRLRELYIDYLRDGIKRLAQYITEQGRAIPWMPVDREDFEDTIDL